MNPTTDLLVRARARIEKGWCQGASARDVNGKELNMYDGQLAVYWCPEGAINAETAADWVTASYARQALRLAIEGTPIYLWNDDPSRTKAEVLDAFDRAIELSKQQ